MRRGYPDSTSCVSPFEIGDDVVYITVGFQDKTEFSLGYRFFAPVKEHCKLAIWKGEGLNEREKIIRRYRHKG